MSSTSFYHQHKTTSEQTIAVLLKQLKRITLFRLLVFGLLLYSIYLAIAVSVSYWALSLLILIAFARLLSYHAKLSYTLRYHQTQLRIAVSESTPFSKTETGLSYLDIEHPFAFDLDVFGEGSLFQLLNRTETPLAEATLANLLLNPKQHIEEIKARQQAITELSSMPELMLEYRVLSALSEQTPAKTTLLKQWFSQPPHLLNKPLYTIALVLVPLLSVLGIILTFSGNFQVLGLAICLNWLLVGTQLRNTNRHHTMVGKQKQGLDQVSKLITLVSETSFQTPLLNNLKQYHTTNKQAMNKLAKLVAIFDQRLNTMLGPILNSLFLFDLICVWRIEKWKEQHGEAVIQWMHQNAQLEALVSLSSYAYANPLYTYPILSSQKLYFEATDLTHPLIKPDKRVANTFTFDEQSKVFIITGSNMSGKSTFLRTIGLTTLCGMIGLPVPAKRMEFTPFNLLSSMRISDSLKDQTSYFYAELKRLKTIMDNMEHHTVPSLLFIDEMLKGTNSKEKLEGSIAIIRKLVQKPCVAFIATHDLALGILEQEFPKAVVNYSFESHIDHNELLFDYTLKKGVAQSTNATYLLHKMEIV
ncbi:MAG: hypothetical protein V4651_14395 [Bacteroidota bacterium]